MANKPLINLDLEPRPRNRKELSILVNYPYDTFRRHLRDVVDLSDGRLLNLAQQEEILHHFGYAVTWLTNGQHR